jgi:hypothetical protein
VRDTIETIPADTGIRQCWHDNVGAYSPEYSRLGLNRIMRFGDPCRGPLRGKRSKGQAFDYPRITSETINLAREVGDSPFNIPFIQSVP